MGPDEFHQKVTSVLLLCNGWMTSGVRSITHNAEEGGIWDSLHQVDLSKDCVLQDKNRKLSTFHHNLSYAPGHAAADATMGDLFVKMCSRMELLAIDEGDHFHVQPR